MIEIKGKNGTAKVFTDQIDRTAELEIKNIMNQEWIKGQEVALMPDVHAGGGNSGPIGLTIMLDQLTIPPSLVGSDIGCGVSLFMTDYVIDDKEELAKWLDETIREKVPYGRNIHNETSPMTDAYKERLDNNIFATFNLYDAINGFGTLGGGNHFIEAYEVDKKLVIAVHSGSRSLGGKVYKYYQKLAKPVMEIRFKRELQEKIKELKDQGRHKEIQANIEQMAKHRMEVSPKNEIPILLDQDAMDYINDVEMLTEYATLSRIEIFKAITKDILDINNVKVIDKPHNYLEVVNIGGQPKIILRKGAQSGYSGEPVLVPINMADGLLFGILKGSQENHLRNYSFPHGAGRVKSRSQAKAELSLEDFENQMTGIYSTSIGYETLDEAPDAYKPIEEILDQTEHLIVEDTAKILKPLYNFKGGKE